MFNSDEDDSENDADYVPPDEELEDEDVNEESEKSSFQKSISKEEELSPNKDYKNKVWENFLADSKSNSPGVSNLPVETAKSDTSNQVTTEKTRCVEINETPKHLGKGLLSKSLIKEGRGVKRCSTLDSLMGKINKKSKVTTLQKSIEDWNNFKREEGIEDSLRAYNKGKGGYIEKQQFLLKSDLASFEKERELRLSKK